MKKEKILVTLISLVFITAGGGLFGSVIKDMITGSIGDVPVLLLSIGAGMVLIGGYLIINVKKIF